jgi:hypothetical protein
MMNQQGEQRMFSKHNRLLAGGLVTSIALAYALVGVVPCASAAETISLAGQWGFQADPQGKGEQERWYERPLAGSIRLPGSMLDNGLGDEVTVETPWTGSILDRSWFDDPQFEPYRKAGNIKLPFWLTPDKHYIGPAWYQRQIDIPQDWAGKRVTLFLERCHWETAVWLDGQLIGTCNSLSTPHEYDLGSPKEGAHTLTIRVDNTVKIGVGRDAHSVSDHTQTNWNGIIGAIELRARDAVSIDDVQVFPGRNRRSAKIRVALKNDSGGTATGRVVVYLADANSGPHDASQQMIPFMTTDRTKTVEINYGIGDGMLPWDEFSPNLYRITVVLWGEGFGSMKTVTFGMRQIAAEDTQFTINGRKTFLRGTLECCIFPLTGHPPMDVESWRKVLKTVKAYGLNHLRFHSWCPPEAAFVAADELGVMYHIECAAWVNSGPTLGDGQPIDQFIYAEGDRILKAYGNHPSFCMLAYGNEPAGDHQKEYLGKLLTYWKGKDPRRLYTSAAGWPNIPQNDYQSMSAPRGHQWGDGLKSRFDYRGIIKPYAVPVVSHEIGQWCVYPNFDEIAKYTGPLKPKNFEIFRDSLAQHHMLDQAHDFLMASGRLQALLYKEEIETALRTPGFGGFQLLDLHDFPGQGTALVGILDPFWESKGYVTAEEHHQYCCETVPLLRMDKCVWTTDETFTGDAEVAHFGPEPLRNAAARWAVTDPKGKIIARGDWPARDIPIGSGTPLGEIKFGLADVAAPAKLTITVSLAGTPYRNHWDLWVYPAKLETPAAPNVLIADKLSDDVAARLTKGGKVLLMPTPDAIASDIPPGFTTIFWNTQWTNRQPPHTLGILCKANHPALADFPTEFHSNWQWWDLVSKSRFMILDDFAAELRPIVQVIDDWNTNRKLGLVFEAKVGPGKLLVCSIDLRSDLSNRPVAHQMLHSLLQYAQSPAFDPRPACTLDQLKVLFK